MEKIYQSGRLEGAVVEWGSGIRSIDADVHAYFLCMKISC